MVARRPLVTWFSTTATLAVEVVEEEEVEEKLLSVSQKVGLDRVGQSEVAPWATEATEATVALKLL